MRKLVQQDSEQVGRAARSAAAPPGSDTSLPSLLWMGERNFQLPRKAQQVILGKASLSRPAPRTKGPLLRALR